MVLQLTVPVCWLQMLVGSYWGKLKYHSTICWQRQGDDTRLQQQCGGSTKCKEASLCRVALNPL